MVEEAQDESSQSDQEDDSASESSDSETEATETVEEEASSDDTAKPEEAAEPKKSGLNIHLVLYPVLLILVAATAILATILVTREDKNQTEANDKSDQLGSEPTSYQITAQSRPILVENITFQTESTGNTVMVALQLIVEKNVHTKWGSLGPDIQSILKTEIKNQTMKELSPETAADLKDYSKRDSYAEEIQKAANDKVFNQFVKKEKKGKKDEKDDTYFESDSVKKVIFYELIVEDN
jgi:flagellar basal body-associated protein FliL